jgi:hypothetical protein
MKVTRFYLALLLFIPGLAQAQVYQSAFGFTTEISDDWLIVSRESLSNSPDLLNFESAGMQGMDQSILAQIKQMAASGKFELLYYGNNDPDFKDNINLFISNPAKTDLSAVESQFCSNLPADIRNAYNRSEFAQVYGCERALLYAVETISYAFDGAVPGSRSFGFLFNSNSGSITLTITCKNSKCGEVTAAAQELFQNIRF